MIGGVDNAYDSPTQYIAADSITPLGGQANEIIASILEDQSPELADIKWRLRRCLAAHPGSPEQALLAHLMATSEMVNTLGEERPPNAG